MALRICGILLKEFYPIRYNIKKSKNKSVSIILGLLLLVCVVIIIYGLKIFVDYFALKDNGSSDIILTNSLILSWILVVISSALNLIYIFNYFGDYSLLLSLPIKSSSIVLGKIIYVIVTKAMIIIPVMLIPFVIYGGYEHCNILYWLRSLIVICFTCTVPIIVISAIIFLLMTFVDWNKIKDYISVFMHIVIITVMVMFITKINSISENLIGAPIISDKSNLYEFMKIFTDFITGSSLVNGFMIIGLGILISIILIGLSIVLNKQIRKVLQKKSNTFFSKSKCLIDTKKYINERTHIGSMLKLDVSDFLRTPDYIVNSIMMLYTVVISLVFTYNEIPEKFTEVKNIVFKDQFTGCLLIGAIVALICSINTINLTAFSRDRLYNQKLFSFPINESEYINSKWIFNMMSSALQIIITSTLLLFLLHFSVLDYIVIIIASAVISAIVNLYTILSDFRLPKRDWKQAYEIMKISLRMLLCIAKTLFLILIYVCAILAVHMWLNKIIVSVIWAICVTALMYLYCKYIKKQYITEKKTGIIHESIIINILKSLGIYYIAQFIIPCFVILILPVFYSVNIDMFVDVYSKNLLLWLLISQIVCLIIYKIDLNSKTQLSNGKMSKKLEPGFYPANVFIGLSMFALISGVLSIFSELKVVTSSSEMLEGIVIDSNVWMTVFVMGITSPLIEEVIFRGIIFKELERKFSERISNIIQAVLFGIYHLNVAQAIYGTVCGLVLGKVKKSQNSLTSSVLVHITFNCTSLILAKDFAVDAKVKYIVLASIFVLTGIYTLVLILRNRKNKLLMNKLG